MSRNLSEKRTHPLVAVFSFFLYASILFQWTWLLLVFLPSIVKTDFFKNYMLPSNTPAVTQTTTPVIPQQLDIVFIILAAIITVALIVATIIAIIRLPATVAKKPKAAIHQAAARTAPFITRHVIHKKVDTLRITKQMVTLFHHLLIALPLLVLLCVFFIKTPLPVEVVFAVGAFLGIWSYTWYIATNLMDNKKRRALNGPSSSNRIK